MLEKRCNGIAAGLHSGLMAIVCVLSACVWNPSNYGTDSFNKQLLIEGGVLVGGVASQNTLLSDDRRRAYGASMSSAFASHYPEARVVESAQIYSDVGRSVFNQMLDSYRFHGTGSTVFMNMLGERYPEVRYAAFARIERESVEHSHREPDSGSGIELQTSRAVIVGMRLFDLHNRRTQVWAAALSDADVNRRRVFGVDSEDELKPLYPDPPPTAAVLEKILNDLAARVGGM